jgi:hypothetical protein
MSTSVKTANPSEPLTVRSSNGINVRASVIALALVMVAPPVSAEPVDRCIVRFTSPETGGTHRPRFLTEHEVAVFARLEALLEEGAVGEDFMDRYQRVTVVRLIAEEMLSQLQIESGLEPPKLMENTAKVREAIEARVGGAANVVDALRIEGVSEAEFTKFLVTRARAMTYIDRGARGLFAPSEEDLFAGWRTMQHPYRSSRFEDMRTKFSAYYALERFRSLEVDFVQSARSRLVMRYL